MNIGTLRREYMQKEGLSKRNLHEDPFKQFEMWFQEASGANIPEPNAMSLATVSTNGEPSVRTVLLKFFDTNGFVFFTNYESNKSREIRENPRVALLFLWTPLERQIQIRGTASRISTLQSAKYFATRPRGSQLGAWCSQQSSIISSRKFLEMKLSEMKRKFVGRQVPLPAFWGGFRVTPDSMEFWQGRLNRLHDRFLYSRKTEGTWDLDRLSP